MTPLHFEDITLLITHFNRTASLARELESFRNLGISFGDIVVSDDGSSADQLDKLKKMQEQHGFRLVTSPVNRGLGHNINKGQEAVRTMYTLYVQEDFVPQARFRTALPQALELLKEDGLDMVRFYAYEKYPYLQPLAHGFSRMKFSPLLPGYKKYYYYSDHPHLRRSDFLKKFGRYAEGISGDQTEYRMMISFLKKRGKAAFYNDYTSLFVQVNSEEEPSTMKRNFWRESDNPVVTAMRHLYRHLKFNLDYLFMFRN